MIPEVVNVDPSAIVGHSEEGECEQNGEGGPYEMSWRSEVKFQLSLSPTMNLRSPISKIGSLDLCLNSNFGDKIWRLEIQIMQWNFTQRDDPCISDDIVVEFVERCQGGNDSKT